MPGQGLKLSLLTAVLLLPGGVLADGLVMEEIMHDVLHGLLKALGEFFEVLFIKENLMLVINERAVTLSAALALRYGKIVVVVAFGAFDIKEVSALTGPHRL